MPETNSITFTHEEVVKLLIKDQELHEGLWGIYIEFGIGLQILVKALMIRIFCLQRLFPLLKLESKGSLNQTAIQLTPQSLIHQ